MVFGGLLRHVGNGHSVFAFRRLKDREHQSTSGPVVNVTLCFGGFGVRYPSVVPASNMRRIESIDCIFADVRVFWTWEERLLDDLSQTVEER